MNTQEKIAATQAIIENAQKLEAALLADMPLPPLEINVRAGMNLQAELDHAGVGVPVRVEQGARFVGSLIVPSGANLLFGPGAGIDAMGTGPAIVVLPGARNIYVGGALLSCTGPEVVTVGANDSRQAKLADVPMSITFEACSIPTHRGKRGFAIHGGDVMLRNVVVEDCWSAAGQDSQAVWLGNSPGTFRASGGRWQAGSNGFLVGGAINAIAGLVPTDIQLNDVELSRPLSWRTDGVRRVVKNLFELKNGRMVRVSGCRLSGCWKDGQGGEAFTLTPALDGSAGAAGKQTGTVEDVLIQNCDVRNVGGIFNILGRHYSSWTLPAVNRLVVQRNVFLADSATFGGTGQLAKIGGELHDASFTENVVLCDGSSLVYLYRGTVMESDGTTHGGGNTASLEYLRNVSLLGKYGFNIDGNASALNQMMVDSLAIDQNRFGGVLPPTAFRSKFTGNSWLTPAGFEALPEVVAARAGARG